MTSISYFSRSNIVASLLDRLSDDMPDIVLEPSSAWRYSLDQYKKAVARDLEWLLNSRVSMTVDIDRWTALKKSLVTYGLPDFSGCSAANESDKKAIGERIHHALTIFEPRLRQVVVHLASDTRTGTQFNFRIEALLSVSNIPEAVIFDAVLEVSTQLYKVE